MSYGQVNADVIGTSVAGSNIGAGNASIIKNRLINGDMRIDQRNAGASIAVADSNVYPIDRFLFRNATDGTATAQQSSTVPTGGGFVNSVVYTVGTADASLAAGQYARIAQVIEGYNFADLQWGTASAKTITISFWVRSSVTGSYSVTLYNSAADRGYAANYTISAANTWEQKTVTIAGDTSGTWLTTNGKGVTVNFGLGAGTDYQLSAGSWTATSNIPLASTTQTNLMATAGATFYITGVQLEVGSSATGYEYRNYTTELQLAQRYYWKNTSVAAYGNMAIGSCDGSTIGIAYAKYPVTMRAVPTISYSTIRIADGTTATAVSSISYNSSTYENMGVAFVASGGTFVLGRAVVIQGNNSTTAFIDATAEL